MAIAININMYEINYTNIYDQEVNKLLPNWIKEMVDCYLNRSKHDKANQLCSFQDYYRSYR